jgi:hypothetical protein
VKIIKRLLYVFSYASSPLPKEAFAEATRPRLETTLDFMLDFILCDDYGFARIRSDIGRNNRAGSGSV